MARLWKSDPDVVRMTKTAGITWQPVLGVGSLGFAGTF